MRADQSFEFPRELQADVAKATRLEWVTIVFLLSVVVLVWLVMGRSQAMKSAWFEDLLSLIPPVSFVIVNRIRRRAQTTEYPYGFHRAVTVGFFASAVALAAVGLFLLYDGGSKLLAAERPTIGTLDFFGHDVWAGWIMIAVMVYSSLPVVFLGRAKRRPGARIHDKILFADSQMNAADWQTGAAAIVGILGIGAGLWWADSAAAVVISLGILRDGVVNLRDAVGDVMDRRPRTVDHSHDLALIGRMKETMQALPWVKDARVRLRENGHVFFGEIAAVPADERQPLQRIAEAEAAMMALDWRIRHLVVTLVHEDCLDEHL